MIVVAFGIAAHSSAMLPNSGRYFTPRVSIRGVMSIPRDAMIETG
jgi:hypothetical protein